MMVIDLGAVKKFWETRAKIYEKTSGLTNLEVDLKLQKLKLTLEGIKMKEYMDFKNQNSILLDLGGGYGQWAFEFADKVKKIYVVEYISELIGLGLKKAMEKNIKNIDFINSSVQQFNSKIKFDIIFISGLLIYLNDENFEVVLNNIKNYSKKDTILILRDGTGIKSRFEINKKYSEVLETNYSAIYRTREEYIDGFKKIGFNLIKDENMFGDGCCLNKFPETRLRIYKFKKEV